MRRASEAVCRIVLRVFFRRVEIVGAERLPAGGVLFAANHPNGLLDPLCVLCHSPRPVSFLAKAPLFDTFLVKHFVRGLECLPIYRARDGFDTKRNGEVLQRAAQLLEAGGAIAIFPEGKTHDEPGLERLKTGPARIALGAKAHGGTVHVVPCAIFYDDKATFRSDAVVVFGVPIEVPEVTVDADGEPPRPETLELTRAIRAGIEAELVDGETHALLRLVALTSRVVRGARCDLGEDDARPPLGDASAGPVERERRLRRRILEGYERFSGEPDSELRSLAARVEALDARCHLHRFDMASPVAPERRIPKLRIAARMLGFLLATPLAVAGIALHFPTFMFNRVVARRLAKGAGELAGSMKLVGGFLFFPATWVLASIVAGLAAQSWPVAALVAGLSPLSGWVALLWLESGHAWRRWARSIRLRATGTAALAGLVEERNAIYERIMALETKLVGQEPPGSPGPT